MKLTDFTAVMECIAPNALALPYDNVGLIIGSSRKQIKKVLVALDCTVETANEAVSTGCDLMLTHHPLFFDPVKRLLPGDPDADAAFMLIRHDIALFCAHTNLDAALGGVNDCLAELLGLVDVTPLPEQNLGRIGIAEQMPIMEFASKTARLLRTTVRVVDGHVPVKRVALVGGAGGSDIYAAAAIGADTFVTGEAKHHQALYARHSCINLIVAGHYETERIVLLPLIERLQRDTDDVQYNLTRFDIPVLTAVAP
ncbi:MAG: Nif3-like dinuclear metal center hexameric protein [Clostridia bacterium]